MTVYVEIYIWNSCWVSWILGQIAQCFKIKTRRDPKHLDSHVATPYTSCSGLCFGRNMSVFVEIIKWRNGSLSLSSARADFKYHAPHLHYSSLSKWWNTLNTSDINLQTSNKSTPTALVTRRMHPEPCNCQMTMRCFRLPYATCGHTNGMNSWNHHSSNQDVPFHSNLTVQWVTKILKTEYPACAHKFKKSSSRQCNVFWSSFDCNETLKSCHIWGWSIPDEIDWKSRFSSPWCKQHASCDPTRAT